MRIEERVEQEDKTEEQWSASSNPHAMEKIQSIRRKRHTRKHEHPSSLIGYLDLCALNGTKTPLGS
jgi:negative regulator of sigma E activity